MPNNVTQSFTPTYLYIKQHSVTGLLYFGKTVKNPEKYFGSGKYWTKHIAKHGKEHVVTLWYYLFTDKHLLLDVATQMSNHLDIVESKKWANLDIETGLNGGARNNNHFKTWSKLPKSVEMKKTMSQNMQDHQTKYGTWSKKRRVQCEIDGIVFESLVAASKHYNVSEQVMYRWCKQGKAIKLPK